MRPHRRQPTRLPRPWDSPGKNTGVGCHFLLQCMKVKMKVKLLSRVRLLATPWMAAHQAPPSMGFPRQEYWSGVPSRWQTSPNQSTNFNAIPIKVPPDFLAEVDILILRFVWRCMGLRISKTVLKKENKIGGLTLPNFKIYSKGTVISSLVLV